MLTVSIHADPTNYFPLFAGYAEETGARAGEGFNLNLPLAWGAGDAEVLAALAIAIERVRAHEPAALVAALGLDGADEDPLGVFNITTQGLS